MYEDGINNEFEDAHQKGLRRGFDLGWSYKGRFDRSIIEDMVSDLGDKIKETNTKRQESNYRCQRFILQRLLKKLKDHPNNREDITINSW
jgi:hypothetical protein